MILTKTNRFGFIAMILIIMSSFNAFAVLEAVCVLAGETQPQGGNTTVDIYIDTWVTFHWQDNENLDIREVQFTYEDPNVANDDNLFMSADHHEDPYQESHNHKSWYVPSNLNGKFIYVTISDYYNSGNKYTFACQVGTSKTQSNFVLEAPKVTCFPNPVVNSLNIKAGNETLNSIELYDLKGNMILHRKINQSYEENIDVSALPTGNYVAIVNEEKQFKIIKK